MNLYIISISRDPGNPILGYGPVRFRRQAPEAKPQRRQGAAGPVFAADAEVSASNVYNAPRGRVGPVYTFVKTDPHANFKWGVRHVAGAQYGRR